MYQVYEKFNVNDKVVIITGSNRGNGFAIASGLVSSGAKVIRIDVSFDSELSSYDIEFDLSNIHKIDLLIKRIYKKFGRIDALVNNAGISIPSRNPYPDQDTFEKTLLINLKSAFMLCSSVCPLMKKQNQGSIVNITSLGSKLGFPSNPSYQVSKAGLRQLTKAIARDWGQYGVRANNICPGYIKTKMTEKSFENKVLFQQRKDQTLIKRWGNPLDLVGPTIFLISEASSYITGTDLYVDGGWTANGGL